MGTISQKLIYLNDTKSLLKESINSLGGEITSQTTFRNYATQLENIYQNLPKVSGSGSNISLTPTLKGRLGSTLKGNTLQDGTPTPSTPVEIQSATGLQNISVCGKNLFDKTTATFKQDYIKNDNGEDTISNGFNYLTSYIKVKPNTTYTLSGNLTNNNGTVRVYYYDKNKNWISRSAGFGANVNICIFTTPNNCYYLQYQYIRAAFNIDTIQLETGSTATTYEAYQSQTKELNLGNIKLNKIGDYQDYITGTPDNWSIVRQIGIKTPTLTNSSVSGLYMDNTTFSGIYKEQLGLNKYLKNIVNTSITDNTTASNLLNNNEFSFRWGTENYRDRLYIKSSLTLSELQALNLEIYYVLKTETTEAITNQEIINQLNEIYYLQSYNGTTNITITSDNLELIMTASALKGES